MVAAWKSRIWVDVKPNRLCSILLGSAGLVLLFLPLSPGFLDYSFRRPSEFLVKLLSASSTHQGEGVLIAQTGILAEITNACSGHGFCGILFFLGSIHCWRKRIPTSLLLLLPLILWCVAILSNSSRVIISVYSQSLANAVFPDKYHPLIHETSGALVFMVVLIGVQMMIIYLSNHEYKKKSGIAPQATS